eukprot:TRINITY_DN139_c7_g1_i1.p1 TRINITY_DN139_c7_g1~~TRINITY_DN139_c7_g1_i1.p1  ORF type:complete len:437 (-),score=212.28 TRINITY_DN139_c7_g1_i1:171-1481(-)
MKKSSLLNLFLVLLSLLIASSIESTPDVNGKRVLALLEDYAIKTSHSRFFSTLEDSGLEIHYALASDSAVRLSKYGEYFYDHLILFAPSVEALPGISIASIVQFIDDGHNVLFVGDKDISTSLVDLGLECGVEFDDSATIIDHLNYANSESNDKHTLILGTAVKESNLVTGPVSNPILFQGIGMRLLDANRLVFPILIGSAAAYSGQPGQVVRSTPFVSGLSTVLIAGLQARNNARVVVSGSLEFFSNRFFGKFEVVENGKNSPGAISTDNEAVGSHIALWAFQQRGVLRTRDITYYQVSDKNATQYRVKEDISYEITLEQYNGKEWIPFKANDVQIEFVRQDPYYRVFLNHDNNGRYSVTFAAPDTYGVYTFRLIYQRRGYTFLKSDQTVAVRPYRHNEYERFIPAAFPYYASVFAIMIGFFITTLILLFNHPKK